jgi:hypothetical protein
MKEIYRRLGEIYFLFLVARFVRRLSKQANNQFNIMTYL